jgi:hypothetical protein
MGSRGSPRDASILLQPAKRMRAEMVKWSGGIRAANIKVE